MSSYSVRLNSQLNDVVSFDILLTENDIQTGSDFPPNRLRKRDERMGQLEKMWLGDLSDFDIAPNYRVMPVTLNYFHNYATKLANLLLMSEPSGITSETGYDCLLDMVRYGGSAIYLLDGVPATADALTWYPGVDYHYLVSPYTSPEARDETPDMVSVWSFPIEGGTVEERTYQWSHSTGAAGAFGPPVSVESVGTGIMGTVPRMPRVGNLWGTAKFLELYGPVVEISNRMTRNSRVLDLNGRPIPVMVMADADADAEFDVDSDDSADAALDKIEEGAVDILNREVVRLPDDVQDFKFEQPNVDGVRVSLEQIGDLRGVLADLTGLPSLDGDYMQSPASGEAIKRTLLHFYADTLTMQKSVIAGFEEIGVTVTWEHIFDVMENQAQMRADQMQQAMRPEGDDESEE